MQFIPFRIKNSPKLYFAIVEIFNISGNFVYKSNFMENTLQIDLGKNSKGVDLIRVFNEKYSYIKKLIIN